MEKVIRLRGGVGLDLRPARMLSIDPWRDATRLDRVDLVVVLVEDDGLACGKLASVTLHLPSFFLRVIPPCVSARLLPTMSSTLRFHARTLAH